MYEIAIIGAGPAGASAAIFSAKAGKKTLVFENNKGMTKHAWFENHYGILEIGGPDLIEIGKQQAVKFGAEIVEDTVLNITSTENGLTITTESGTSYEAKHIIFATGAATDLAVHIGLATKDGTEPRIKTIIDVDASGKTSIPGIWAAGTVAGVSVHAIITAGDGAKAAINIISELNGSRYVDHDMMKKA
ncbi:FAD-binding protein [Paenibacillus psychroresistens]|uniref:FAD-binding protein n=1 Tax=Paenibacillus psychroresistens TaxID=1778678 RepID=A0A6B8RSZ3_9BACL|nr:FAD-dependent oxidoreductase [Paenibacillus psychroresistens]QGQ99570.1 FAD-binding protein [Paenibacillus psychroresistens]